LEQGIPKKGRPRKRESPPEAAAKKAAKLNKPSSRGKNNKFGGRKKSPETPFIVCPRRKSRPMMAPFVCEKRCKYLKVCPSYYAYVQPGLFEKSIFSTKRGSRLKK